MNSKYVISKTLVSLKGIVTKVGFMNLLGTYIYIYIFTHTHTHTYIYIK